MDRPPIESKNVELNPEAIAKSDMDIRTIAALGSIASEKGARLVLSGGYATEALCGGKVTRPHGDIDARFIFEQFTDDSMVFPDIEEMLKMEQTHWKVRVKHPGKADYIEDDERKSFFDRRRLEVYIPAPGWFDVNFEDAMLIDSKGGAVAVGVIGYENLLASKISKFHEIKDGINEEKDRLPSQTDINDIKRLISLDRFDKEKVLAALVKHTHSKAKANEVWDYVTSIGIDLKK